MVSVQIQTAPLVRNFAIPLAGSAVQVCTKLGPLTVMRATFDLKNYPIDAEEQRQFLTELVCRSNPAAIDLLQDTACRCIEDQQRAIEVLMSQPA